eukprot:CAMPEP_0206456102 /NCGR_PEP_ID=MMETSP0324_2-20121206/22166_1 /ASSEMBLY_ACC=CAM_ASM_000836 /TAXON_ID=2866 /ORGANISM="Crypthecodinium cohnii, Strain Seligo" /LENGTH=322 /DNA_ID=CAMNT_0053926969 /DNA_START=124 /DNA_END=1090 /DNA_ORIENTATION=-
MAAVMANTPSVASSSAPTATLKESKNRRSSLASSATVSTIQGDRSRRIAVPMPRSMADLHNNAARFGMSGVDFYHHGKKHIKHDGHVDRLGHEHVVVVTGWDKHTEPTPMSTHNDTYKAHRIEPRKGPAPHSARNPLPFEGTATSADYKAHTIDPRRSPGRAPAPKSEPFLGNSTHLTDYVPHKIEARKAYERPPAAKQEPFNGTRTSDDFCAHRIEARTAPGRPKAPPSQPFNGNSSYQEAYIPHAVKVNKPFERPAASPSLPFESTSEYLQNYMGHKIAKREMVHMEPAIHQGGGTGADAPSRLDTEQPESLLLLRALFL